MSNHAHEASSSGSPSSEVVRIARRRRRMLAVVSVASVSVLSLVTVARGQALDALNAIIATLGPVPGQIAAQLPANLDPLEANELAFEGGESGTKDDTTLDLNTNNLSSNGGIDVPTGARPSPLFGARAFEQPVLLFEEFGVQPLDGSYSAADQAPLPPPSDPEHGPDPAALDRFLAQRLYPLPSRESNTQDTNPWQPEIEAFLGRPLEHPPAEGRPPGAEWAHQRWDEYRPAVYFKTVQAGARVNAGVRDTLQSHGYRAGEFGPGGLYHQTALGAAFAGTTRGIEPRFHPRFPLQGSQSAWTFDGTFPPKLLRARYGEPVLMRHYNALPIDPSANSGFGLHTISTHEHNGHNPSESDGYTQAFFFPGQFYDYRWPMTLAGSDSINVGASDARAGAPDGSGGIRRLRGNWRETMSTHWFHDHMLDFTAQNVYKGNAAMMNYYSALDRGNEAINDGVNLRLPSGSALDWGNRDYDVNLVLADKAWDAQGQLFFNIFNTDGFLGDQLLTNWTYKPYLDVRARRYRFRILNGAVSRYLRLALVAQVNGTKGEYAGPAGSNLSYNRVPFYMIANDGNLLEHAVYFDGKTTVNGFQNRLGTLPVQAIAERYDIVVDFAKFAPGTKLYFVNLLEHQNGRKPNREVPLGDILSGKYAPLVKNDRNTTDPTVTQFLELRVQAYSGRDLSMDPAEYVAGKKQMLPLPVFTEAELKAAVHRTFEFGRSQGTDEMPWTIKVDGGPGFNMDPRRLSAAPKQGAVEIWHLRGNGGWSHPVHIHFEEGVIMKRGGKEPPEWERWARKDVYRIGPEDDSTESVDLAIRFREFFGTFVEHCHNTQHEDTSMLLRWDLEQPGQLRVMPTPLPSWDGVGYMKTYALPSFRTGDTAAASKATRSDFGRLVQ